MKVLVIEDEHKIAQSIKKGLEQESYIVDLAFTGSQGLELAMTGEMDLIILDRMLPEIDGVEICRRLRQQQVHLPILMLTAKGQVADKVAGLDAGADDYLVKPFAFEELLARLRALIRRPIDQVPTIIRVADLELDANNYQVYRQQQPIELSHREFALLEYLIRHAGQIVSKDQILNHVWSYDSEVLPNTVEVYIGYLRQKIDKPFSNQPPLINTVRGFGYRLGVRK